MIECSVLVRTVLISLQVACSIPKGIILSSSFWKLCKNIVQSDRFESQTHDLGHSKRTQSSMPLSYKAILFLLLNNKFI